MQLPRPILLEGPPGVGKTSIISNLAAQSGHKLVRINLSEHSEISDLLGTDLPASALGDEDNEYCDDGDAMEWTSEEKRETSTSSSSGFPKFKWSDGVFLAAMKRGDWVLLDELNLAPQSVLEGLNACFDHREEVYLPELGMTVRAPPTFRVFCAQNPMVEGGGRKGLPQSFLTRFSRVYVDAMTAQDMEEIANSSFASTTTALGSVSTAASTSSLSQHVKVLSLQEQQQQQRAQEDRMDEEDGQDTSRPSVSDYIPRMVRFIRLLQ